MTKVIKNVIMALIRIIYAIWKRYKLRVPKEEFERRLDICAKCVQLEERTWLFVFMVPKCSQCGCNMRIKARLSTEKCELGKWETK